MTESVRFDRAVDYYDSTRGLSEGAVGAVSDLLVAELRGREPVLEIGVGTGLIALPLAERGVRMAGVDISQPMLRKLLEKSRDPFPVAVADATRLPFADGSFGGAIARHVFHLIRNWEGAVAELARVVRPGGIVLVHPGDLTPIRWAAVDRFLEVAGGRPFAIGLDPRDTEALDRAMSRHGATGRALKSIPERLDDTVASFLDQMEVGYHSWTWDVDEETRRRAAQAARARVRERYGAPEELEEPLEIAWRAYDLP
ncbi:MAG TPA: class I SAM-dependent methyltransferase [Actinomycetota bacterium]|nr:class I SAM-dependent methyltransferase [Actinomycetota bacterium]